MPYGLPDKLNTTENNAKMERCVADVQAKGYDKVSAIRICKSSIIKNSIKDILKNRRKK